MVVEESTVNDCAGLPPIITDDASLKLCPVIVTIVLLPPLMGENEVMTGGGIN